MFFMRRRNHNIVEMDKARLERLEGKKKKAEKDHDASSEGKLERSGSNKKADV
jgi:hypothetical protein